jgi:hypothetical protein
MPKENRDQGSTAGPAGAFAMTENSEVQRKASLISRHIFGSTQPKGENSPPELKVSPGGSHKVPKHHKNAVCPSCGSNKTWRDSHWESMFWSLPIKQIANDAVIVESKINRKLHRTI